MRTSLNASLPWTRLPSRDGTPQGVATTGGKPAPQAQVKSPERPATRAPRATTPAAKTPAAKTSAARTSAARTPEAKLAKQAAAEVAKKPVNRNPSPAQIRQMLSEVAERHGIPPEILMAIAYKESNWRHYGRDGGVLRGRWSPTDQGIMQINEKAHPNAFPRARTDMRYNIEYGARYLKYQYDRYKNWNEAVAAYNTGSVLRKRNKIVNQYYVDKVMSFKMQFEKGPDAMPTDG